MADGTRTKPGPGKWNLWRAALYGVVLSVLVNLYAFLRGTPLPEDVPPDMHAAFIASVWLGRALVFALVFVFVAGVRNLWAHFNAGQGRQ